MLRKKLVIFTFLLVCLNTIPKAQSIQPTLSYSLGGNYNEYGYGVGADINKNYYITGKFNSSNSSFQQLSNAGSDDVFLTKYDQLGNPIWAKSAGGINTDVATSISVTEDAVYIAGYFQEFIKFDTSIQAIGSTLYSCGSYDIFLAKYDLDGHFVWARRAGGIADDRALGVASDGVHVIIAGYYRDSANFNTPSIPGQNELVSYRYDDMFIACYDADGSLQWKETAGGDGADNITGVTIVNQAVYISGLTNSTTVSFWGSGYFDNFGAYSGLLAKYDLSGNNAWCRRIGRANGATGIAQASSVAGNESGVYIAGTFNSLINFNTPSHAGINELAIGGNNDAFLAKFDHDGTYLWSRRIGSTGAGNTSGNAIACDTNNVFICGNFEYNINFNTPTQSGINSISGIGYTDMFFGSFDNSGSLNWYKRGGSLAYDQANAVAISGQDVIATGEFGNPCNFNTPSSSTTNLINSHGMGDAFFVRFSPCNVPPPDGSLFQSLCTGSQVSDLLVTGNQIEWWSDSTAGYYLYPTTNLNSGTTYFAEQLINGCRSEQRKPVQVSLINRPEAPTGASVQTICSGQTTEALSVIGTNVSWYSSSNSLIPVDTTVALENSTLYYASQTVDGCESQNRLSVLVGIQTVDVSVSVTGNSLQALGQGNSYQWFDCSTQLEISNQTSSFYTAAANGSYAVIITQNGCSDTSQCYEIQIPVSLSEEISLLPMVSFPNPCHDQLYFIFPAKEGCKAILVEIMNTQGEIILNTKLDKNNRVTDSLSILPNGLYFAVVKDYDSKVILGKNPIIKQ